MERQGKARHGMARYILIAIKIFYIPKYFKTRYILIVFQLFKE
jgi:hypothetical protein